MVPAVLVALFVWEIAAPTALLWTALVPLVYAANQFKAHDPVWPSFVGVLLLFLVGKHPLGSALRFV